jgi:hypothetical protein
MRLIIFLLLVSFSASAQTFKDWTFASVRVHHQDSTMKGRKVNRIIDTTFGHKAIWICNSSAKTITMDIPAAKWERTWTYDSMSIKTTAKTSEYGQYYHMHQKTEQDVMLIIYYPKLSKMIEIGVENGKQVRAKYEAQ